MYRAKTKFLLEIMEKLGEFSIGILDVLLKTYPDHYKKSKRKMFYGSFYDELFEKPKETSFEDYKKLEAQKFYNLLNHLQKQGLVKKNKEGRCSTWGITEKGRKKLIEISEKISIKLPRRFYKKENDKNLKIIIFDIPEEESRKRLWLRQSLFALGFSKLQKSVWVGSIKLPKDFIEDLKVIDIFQYIEIFSVSKEGTIGKNKYR